MNKAKVIDTSYHKGQIDWQAVKDGGGVEGVILKASDGFFMPDDMEGTTWTGHSDPSFILYWKELKKIIKWRAAYHFLRVDDEIAIRKGRLTSQEQIHYFYNLVTNQGLEWDDYIILDVEQSFSQIDYLSEATVAARVESVIRLTEELFKRKPIIYTGAWWWERFHKHFNTEFIYNYPFWLSHYWPINDKTGNEIISSGYYYYIKPNRLFPTEWLSKLEDRIAYCRLPEINNVPTINPDKVFLWQYSSSGNIDTVSNNTDVNMYIVPEENWTEARGENQEAPPQPPAEDCTKCRETVDCLTTHIAEFNSKITNCLAEQEDCS